MRDKVIVELKNVTKYFERGIIRKRKNYAVIDVSLKIREGDIITLIGESGCGKTTLGRIIAGLIKPSKGTVLWFGKDVWKMKKKEFKKYRPLIQLVHQDPYASLNPARTVYQILAPIVKKYYKPKSAAELEKEVKNVLRYVGLTPPDYFLNKYPHHLSGGMRQRLAFARALIPKPKLIVADEPVSMIDMSLRLSVLALMKKFNEEFGIAFVYISHDIATARYFEDKATLSLMYLGRIVETGPMRDVLRNPMHPYLRAILSATPVPDPRITRHKRKLELKSLEVPREIVMLESCPFSPRCPYSEEICFKQVPPPKEYDGHIVACHLVDKLPKWIPPWQVAV